MYQQFFVLYLEGWKNSLGFISFVVLYGDIHPFILSPWWKVMGNPKIYSYPCINREEILPHVVVTVWEGIDIKAAHRWFEYRLSGSYQSCQARSTWETGRFPADFLMENFFSIKPGPPIGCQGWLSAVTQLRVELMLICLELCETTTGEIVPWCAKCFWENVIDFLLAKSKHLLPALHRLPVVSL